MATFISNTGASIGVRQNVSDEIVLTIPGFLAGRGSLQRASESIRSAGYQCRQWDYASLCGSLSKHADRLSRDLRELAECGSISRIHFVAHSMGAIIARAAIHASGLESRFFRKCGNLVMLAPPNEGSKLTRIPLGPFATWFPQLRELSESSDSFVRQLPTLRYMPVGVIAAQRDFVVEPAATHLPGERAHATLPTTHQALVSDPEAIEMSIRFLSTASFDAAPATQPFPRPVQRRPVHSAAA